MDFLESLTDMMERIGGHLSYLSECSSAAFQDSEKIQEVRMRSMESNLFVLKLLHKILTIRYDFIDIGCCV